MSLLEDLRAGKLHQFHGGIHPPQRKAPANLTPISEAGLPDELILQVRQHIGQAAQLKVAVGEQVLKGQLLTEPLNPMMIPVHAPTSGTISAIEDRPLCHPSGLSGLCVVLVPDGKEEWRARYPIADYTLLDTDVLLNRLHQAGIAGLGGAGFPAHVKLTPRQTAIETLIINGIECEPYISADDRLMREYPGAIVEGIAILRHMVKPKNTLLAVEDNKPEAIAALADALKEANLSEHVQLVTVPTIYPSGGEKQLIEVLTGQQVPSQGLPANLGIVMQNVGTAFAIRQAIIEDEPLLRRVVTLAGDAFSEPGNAWVHIGTPVRYLLTRYGLQAEPEQRIVMGGPMMGFTLHTAAAPIIKGSNCILAPTLAELPPPAPELACIRCSQCADACPASLLPQQLYWYANSQDHDKLQSHNLFDCIECGACAYVCPSSIPLVQYYRVAKAEIREAQHEAEQAERAKLRFEARLERLAKEKAERQARQAKAAAERKARMEKQKAATGEDPVAAALARVKARKQGEQPEDMAAAREARKAEARRNRELKAQQADKPAADDKQSAVQAAVARAKARKAAQENTAAASESTTPADDKQAAVKAAVARAKARKAAEAGEATASENTAPADDKQAKIQAAVARAKARKAAQENADAASEIAAPAEDKQAAVKAAVARAKARKAAQENENAASENTAPADDKQAAVKAAVARAKARKAAQEANTESASENNEPPANAEPDSPEDDKQAKIKAAVARAKARKAAQAAEENEEAASQPEVTSSKTAEPAAADDKQAKIQAAVARAKARKAAQAASLESASENSEPPALAESDSPEDDKQAKIKAAVARAKARKAAQASTSSDQESES